MSSHPPRQPPLNHLLLHRQLPRQHLKQKKSKGEHIRTLCQSSELRTLGRQMPGRPKNRRRHVAFCHVYFSCFISLCGWWAEWRCDGDTSTLSPCPSSAGVSSSNSTEDSLSRSLDPTRCLDCPPTGSGRWVASHCLRERHRTPPILSNHDASAFLGSKLLPKTPTPPVGCPLPTALEQGWFCLEAPPYRDTQGVVGTWSVIESSSLSHTNPTPPSPS